MKDNDCIVPIVMQFQIINVHFTFWVLNTLKSCEAPIMGVTCWFCKKGASLGGVRFFWLIVLLTAAAAAAAVTTEGF